MKFTDILTSSAHAYIVEARPSSVRDAFVKDFVKGLNCLDDNPDSRPCNTCASCRQIDAGTSMDVFHMEMSGKSGYRVDDTLPFIERLEMGAYGKHVIGIIDDADLLSEILQNKLLKTLEEPEPGAVIVLVTGNADNLLLTVRSRCNMVRVADFVGNTEDESDDSILKIADQLSQGCKFYECRDIIDKQIKTQESAMELLGSMEDQYRNRMLEGLDRDAMVKNIDLIETARMDIYRGMNYSKALRRLCLELA